MPRCFRRGEIGQQNCGVRTPKWQQRKIPISRYLSSCPSLKPAFWQTTFLRTRYKWCFELLQYKVKSLHFVQNRPDQLLQTNMTCVAASERRLEGESQSCQEVFWPKKRSSLKTLQRGDVESLTNAGSVEGESGFGSRLAGHLGPCLSKGLLWKRCHKGSILLFQKSI